MDWLKRDGRSLSDPVKNPWCGDFVETCIRIALPNEPLLGALGTNPYRTGTWLLFGQAVQPIVAAPQPVVSSIWRCCTVVPLKRREKGA